MKMTKTKPSSYHVPRLKLILTRHTCFSGSVFKILFFIFLLGLIGAASQDSAVLKLSAQEFNSDFRGNPIQSSHLPLSSASSLQPDDEVELLSLFESRRENRSLDQSSLINDSPKNQTVQRSSVPTTSNTLISSENESTFREKEKDTILSKHKRSKVVRDSYSGENSELISSERNNSKVSSSEEVENQIELLRVMTHSFESSTEMSTLKESPRFRSHNMWTNQSLLENQLFDEEDGDSGGEEEESFQTSSEKPLKYIASGKRPRRSVMHLYDMVMCGTGGCNPLAYKGYGCYCGFLGSGIPVDGIDRCCAKHDWCYHHAKCPPLLTYFVPYYWTCNEGRPNCVTDYRGWKGVCGAHLCECDRIFAQCLQKYPCPRSRAMCMTSPWRFWQNLVMQPPYG